MFLWVKTVAKKLLNNFTNYYLAPHLLPTLIHTEKLRCLTQKKTATKIWHLGELNLLTQQIRAKVAAILP